MDEETVLIEKARKGSEDAFAELLRRHQAQVRAFLGGFVRNWDAVEDLAQETFFAAFRGLETYKSDSPLRIWLFGIARNQALMWLRDQGRRRSHVPDSLESTLARWLTRRAESASADTAEQERRLSTLDSCLEKLPRTSSDLVQGFYVQNRTAAEIGRKIGKREGAVWKALFRIREALRQCVESMLAGAGESRG